MSNKHKKLGQSWLQSEQRIEGDSKCDLLQMIFHKDDQAQERDGEEEPNRLYDHTDSHLDSTPNLLGPCQMLDS